MLMTLTVENQLQISEAATEDALQKKVFLKLSQNSQENTCARVSFLIKLDPTQACNFILKTDLNFISFKNT